VPPVENEFHAPCGENLGEREEAGLVGNGEQCALNFHAHKKILETRASLQPANGDSATNLGVRRPDWEPLDCNHTTLQPINILGV